MPFGQIVVGPPGSGKTTYCYGMSQFYAATKREAAIVNLDPANDGLPYTPDIDVSELITLEDCMEEFGLGPNGGLIYCMEYLDKNFDWLEQRLKSLGDKYILFDCPGQVELFTHHNSVRNIVNRLQKLDYRLTSVHLVDAHYCVDPSKYVAMLLLSLKTMIQLELPHINVLSKVDLMESYGKLAFSLDYYTEVQDLSYLLESLNTNPSTARYAALNSALCELVEDFSLVGFYTLCIEDKESVINLARAIDKTNGYVYGGLEVGNESIFQTAERVGRWMEDFENVKEKYLAGDEDGMEGLGGGAASGPGSLVHDILEQWGDEVTADGEDMVDEEEVEDDDDDDMPPLDHS
ncbi:GPN-loop GTPase 2 [Rhizophlyctis rosea]|nr:GPN-loop GTPase 2 [Rhizophlyctis rosea]